MNLKGEFKDKFREWLPTTDFGRKLTTLYLDPYIFYRWLPVMVQFYYVAEFYGTVKSSKIYLLPYITSERTTLWDVVEIHPEFGRIFITINCLKVELACQKAVEYLQKKYESEKISPPFEFKNLKL